MDIEIHVLHSRNENNYSKWIGFIFIFNLIVGTGALTLPAGFAKAGWLLSLAVISLLALISYMTVTFVVEALAAANAVKTWQNLQVQKRSYYDIDFRDAIRHGSRNVLFQNDHLQHECSPITVPDEDTSEEDELRRTLLPQSSNIINARSPSYAQQSSLVYYHLDEKLELGEIASLFFNKFGCLMFYACFCIYLYGDLSIYSAAVSKSLRNLICDQQYENDTSYYDEQAMFSNESSITPIMSKNVILESCWLTEVNFFFTGHNWTRLGVYRLMLTLFTLLLGPFTAFSIQKTKYLQITTAICRWCAFILMISIAIKILCTQGAKGHPVATNFGGLPSVFGACIYSFMCHHSLPSLLTPIRDKEKSVYNIIRLDYIIICVFYIFLALTGILAFEHVEDLYTLNFIPEKNSTANHSLRVNLEIVVDYFLTLFPVFTLSANFPIVAITLKNNLHFLFLSVTRYETSNAIFQRLFFPLLVITPPFIITFYTENLTSLVAFTGSYAGTGIQYLIPIALVYYSRITCSELLGNGVINKFQSPFRSTYWILFVLVWCIACITLVTIDLFLKSKDL